MIGPVSSTGRAMMASLQQAMAKGMPADQAIAYVKSMAQQGVAPLTDLYSMLTQFQRLKQQPAQMPQTPPTVRDQINMAAQQRDMQERAMAQGLGGMNAGSMENPSFAGGGIVAFAEGDLVTPYGGAPSMAQERIRLTNAIKNAIARGAPPEEIASLKNDLDQLGLVSGPGRLSEGALNQKIRSMGIAPAMEQFAVSPEVPEFSVAEEAAPDLMRESAERSVDQTGTSYVPPRKSVAERKVVAAAPAKPAEDSLEPELSMLERLQKSRGIGAASEKAMQSLAQEEADYKAQLSKDRSLALAQFGFRMAREAAKPGATFMGSLGAGGEEYVRSIQELSKISREFQRNLNRERINIERSKELIAAGNIDAALKLRNSALDRLEKQKELQSREAMAMFAAQAEKEGRMATIAATDRATTANLLRNAGEMYTDQIAKLSMNPEYLDADDAGKAKITQQVFNNTYGMMMNQFSKLTGQNVRGDLPYGARLRFNPETGKVE